MTSNVLDPETEEIHISEVELAPVLQFVTGCDGIPAIGFDTSISTMFDHDKPHRKLTANTCSCTLNFPVCDLLTNYESFKNEFTESCITILLMVWSGQKHLKMYKHFLSL